MDMNSKPEDGKKREWDTRTKNNTNKVTPAQNLDVMRRLHIYKLIINGITLTLPPPTSHLPTQRVPTYLTPHHLTTSPHKHTSPNNNRQQTVLTTPQNKTRHDLGNQSQELIISYTQETETEMESETETAAK
ncbi:hypothetical protein EAF00_005635 [Botryotinia globosa]|nr:hypothetical protein EAF00_005635 [Botryotinia globosa]